MGELTIDKVDVISSVPTSTESLSEEIEGDEAPIIKYLMANVGVLVGIIIAVVLLLVIIGMSIFICYKFCSCCKCCHFCKCKNGICCQSCQTDTENGKDEAMPMMITPSLTESARGPH